jgi:hypothetical protein
VPIFAAILRVPFSIIAPLILVLCAIGAYSVHSSTFDVVLMLVFGVVGYLLKKTNYPLAPLVLAIVLGDKAEEAFRPCSGRRSRKAGAGCVRLRLLPDKRLKAILERDDCYGHCALSF